MVMHVVRRTSSSRFVSRVIVATDDERIADAVRKHGGEAIITSSELTSGTDRVAQVAATLHAQVYVNVQGDEPLIDPATIDSAIEPLFAEDSRPAHVSTTSEPITDVDDVFNSNVVKVVSDAHGFALYFSRSPIPFIRPAAGQTLKETLSADPTLLSRYRKHSGLYAYRSDFLKQFSEIKPSPLERLEQLEQLRAIENGFNIRVVPVEHRSIGVDTEQDYLRVKSLIEENRI